MLPDGIRHEITNIRENQGKKNNQPHQGQLLEAGFKGKRGA